MQNWLYKGKEIIQIEDLPEHEKLVGFVYKITNTETGKFYIGKKILNFSRKIKITMKEKLATGTKKGVKRVSKPSDWLNYWGSCKELTSELKSQGTKSYKREIIELCCTKKYLNYCELAYQIKLDVLSSNSYNANILSRYFRKDLINCI